MNPMPTLELTLQRKTDSCYPVVAALTRPGGFLPLRREGMLNLDLAALADLQFEPLEYGTALGKALFVEEIRDTFREGLAGGEPLRVLLSVEAPDLRALDWHRLAAPFDGRWRFLAVQQNTPFSLAVPSPASVHFPAIGRRDLRALVLVAGPESLSGDYKLAPFDVAATLESVQTALGDLPCDTLPAPSLDALCAALTAAPYTILHLVCHGAVNERGETILYFPKDDRRFPTPASDLLDRLSSLSRLPHFVFLSACESALPQNGLGSLAGRLVRELGLPAVLAMTDRVSIVTAQAIAAPFYAQLRQHGQPDLALTQALAGLQGKHDLTVPALLSRLGDRALFDDNTERSLTDKELEFGLDKLAQTLTERAPVMDSLRDSLTRRLRSTLGADSKSLSDSRRSERKDALEKLNSLSLEALDLSFNALCLGQTPPAYDSRSPFRGLESFRPEDAEYFFGRETLTKKLVQKLTEHNFLAGLGASGSGKSSLVMAGLIPALNVPYAIFRPGAEPLAELEKALQAGPALLVVDQFEELFTLSAQEQRADFISRLLEQSQRLRVVITLRADFLGEVAPFKSLKDEVQNHQEIIPPMDEVELRRAMEGQAVYAGLRFESDLRQQMLDDVSGEPGAMPLLQHALWTLWMRRHGRWLRSEEYRAFGGVKQAIASTAEVVYARCTDFECERLRDIFLRLTRLDADASADGRDTRRRVLLRDLILAENTRGKPADSEPAATTLLIKQLADARLVVVTGDEVEVAHEALIRHWERLRAWLNDDRDNLRLREGVSDDARRWEDAARDESLLNHRGPRLELALAMSKNPRYRLNPVEQAYLDGCVGLKEREKATATRRRRFTTAGVSAALVLIMAILAGWGWTSNQNAIELVYQASTADAAKATAVGEANIRATAQEDALIQAATAVSAQAEANNQKAYAENNLARSESLRLALEAERILSQPNGNVETVALLSIRALQQVYTSQADSTLAKSISRLYAIRAYSEYMSGATNVIVSSGGKYVLPQGGVNSVAFSPEGKYVLMGSTDKTAKLWETATGVELHTFSGHTDWVNSVAFSPDGKYVLTGSTDTTAKLWDIATGVELRTFSGHTSAVSSVAFSPDGKYVLTGSTDTTAKERDTATGVELRTFSGHTRAVTSVAFSPDGKYALTGSADNTAKLWDAATGVELRTFSGHTDCVTSVAFSPDGKYVLTGGNDNTAKLWDTATGMELRTFSGHTGGVNSVAFSPYGEYSVIGGNDNTTIFLDTTTDSGHTGGVNSVAFSPDGKYVLTGGNDNTAKMWVTSTGVELRTFSGHTGAVISVAFSPDGKYVLTGSADNTAKSWDTSAEAASGTEGHTFNGHTSAVICVAFSPDGKYVLTGSADSTAILWDAVTGIKVRTFNSQTGGVGSVAFSPDGKYVLTGSGSFLTIGTETQNILWDTATGAVVRTFNERPGGIGSVAFSPDGKYMVTGSMNNARLWDVVTGAELRTFSGHMWYVSFVAFSPDGKYVLTGSWDNTAKLWDAATGNVVHTFEGHTDYISSVAFSPDGKYVLTGSLDRTAKLWNVVTGVALRTFSRHTDWVTSVAFSPDGKYVLTGSADKTAKLWDAATGADLRTFDAHTSVVWGVTFSPDGTYLLTGSADNTAKLWNIHYENVIHWACTHLTRNLTRDEWRQYIGNALQYQAVCPNLPIEPEPTATPTP